MQHYLAEFVRHGLGISVVPPMSVRAVTAATRPPTGAAQALLDLLAADISSQRSQAAERSSGSEPTARPNSH